MRSPHPLVTAADLERLEPLHPRAELWDGVLFVREPATPWHGGVGARVTASLHAHVDARGLGWVFDASVGFLLARDPDRVLEPDASYVARGRLPVLPKRGFPALAPDLVVEIRSPDASWSEQYAKGLVWIGHGVRVAWLLNPPERRAVVLRADAAPVVVSPGDFLDAAPALDLRLPLDDLLRGVP